MCIRWLSLLKISEAEFNCSTMTLFLWIIFHKRSDVDWSNISALEKKASGSGKPKIAEQANWPSRSAKRIANPSCPREKIGVVAREADQAELVFKQYLLSEVYKSCKNCRICSIIFLG